MSRLNEILHKLNETLNKISKKFGLKTQADMSDADFFLSGISFWLYCFIISLILLLIICLLEYLGFINEYGQFVM